MPAANAVIQFPATAANPIIIEAVATIDFASTLTNVESAGIAVTGITGARAGDHVTVTRIDGTRQAGEDFVGSVTANDQVTVFFQNLSAGTVDLASANFRIRVAKALT